MHLLGQSTLGILILLSIVMLVIIKQLTTGSILEKPTGVFRVWLANIFNLFFLLIALPLTAILLVIGKMDVSDPSHLNVNGKGLLLVLEIAGMVLFVLGNFLMDWALITLRRNFQLGGSTPRSGDELIKTGPYRLVRHPMYTAGLGMFLGLTFLVQSSALFFLFWIYLILIILMIPVEEDRLKQAYGEKYMAYQQEARKLVPFCY
jgi:protein-S-isoprenylcysteine O-methyltransferase Ste14